MDQINIKQLAHELSKEIKDSRNEFWIDAEKHYNDHIKFCGWVKFFDDCKKDLILVGRRLFMTGCIVAVGFGIYFAVNY